jgi:tRNA(fMet)-specific endonuclease VapC
MKYLLDTNMVSDLVRAPRGRVADRLRAIGEAHVCTSIVVAAELRCGAEKKGSARLTKQLEAVLGALDVLALDEPVDATYGSIRVHLERTGRPIGANDLLIAAQTVVLGHTLVTDNEREFTRVPGLACENWLRG